MMRSRNSLSLVKNRLYTLIGISVTAIIAISAIGISLFQQGKGPLAPTAPESQPAASTLTSESCTLTFSVITPTATPTYTPTPSNTATPTYTPTYTPTPTNTATPTVTPSADLLVIKTVNKTAPIVGENVTYTITVTNSGPNTATGVVIKDTIQPQTGLEIVTHSVSQGTFNTTTGVWTVGTIVAKQDAILTITAKVVSAENITNLAEVIESNQPDPDSTPGNYDPNNPSTDEDDNDSTTISPVAPTPTPSNTPSPTNTPTPTPSNTPIPTNTPTLTPTSTVTPSITPSATPEPTATLACVDVQSQAVTPACVTCSTCLSTINWQWATLTGATQYQIDVYNAQDQLLEDNDWQAASAFNCNSKICEYSSSHSRGSYYAVISAQGDGLCFNSETTPNIAVELCTDTITPTGLPNAGSTGPTVLLFGVGAVAVILGILGFLFVF